MGVSGLLKQVPSKRVNVSAYAGQRVAVDAVAWMYRALKNKECATRLALRQSVAASLLGFLRNRIAMLKSHGVGLGMWAGWPGEPP